MRRIPRRWRGRGGGRRVVGLALAAAVTAGGGAACATVVSTITTADAVGRAVRADLDRPGLGLRISVLASPAALRTFAASDPATGAQLRALRAASLTVEFHTGRGEALDSPAASRDRDDSFAVLLRLGGVVPVEVREVHGLLYARLDASELLTGVGMAPGTASLEAARVRRDLDRAATTVAGLAALGRGRWVSADPASLRSLAPPASAPPTTATRTGALGQVDSALRLAFSGSASLADEGTHGGRREYRVSVGVHTFATRFADLLPPSVLEPFDTLGAAGSGASAALRRAAAKVPQRSVTLTLWVRDDRVEEIDVDLAQFSGPGAPPVTLRVVISDSGAVSAPPGATPLDLRRLHAPSL